jgi:hypothetical protein
MMMNCMEQNPSWQANSSLASQPIVHVWWSPKFHYSSHNSRPLIPILSQINPADALSPSFLNVRFNIILSSMSRSTEWSHNSRFPHQNPARTSLHPREYHTTHSYHSPGLNCPTSIWWGASVMKYFFTRFSSTSCYFLSLPHKVSSAWTFSLCALVLTVRRNVSRSYRTTGKITVPYILRRQKWTYDILDRQVASIPRI